MVICVPLSHFYTLNPGFSSMSLNSAPLSVFENLKALTKKALFKRVVF